MLYDRCNHRVQPRIQCQEAQDEIADPVVVEAVPVIKAYHPSWDRDCDESWRSDS